MSRFLVENDCPLVADASVLINLHASGADRILLAGVKHPLVVTQNAVDELERGRRRGYSDAERLAESISAGLFRVKSASGHFQAIYESLIAGAATETLDDGEAATLALALELEGIALIDEQKALRIATERFPSLEIICTAELFLHPIAVELLGVEGQATAIHKSLRDARMRVPPNLIESVATLLGPERVVECRSIPKHVRDRFGRVSV